MITLTSDYTYQFLDSGVLLNSPESVVPFIDVNQVQGLDSAPFRVTERVREGMDGGFIDALWEDMRLIVISGTIYATASTIEALIDSLKANFAPNATPQPFYIYHPTVGQRIVYCKSYGIKIDVDTGRRTGIAAFQIQLKAEDPTIYGPPVTLSSGIATANTGFGFNHGFNYGFGGTTSISGVVNAHNNGNKPSGALITLTNVDQPTVISDSTGGLLSFNITLSSGLYLTIDLRNRSVLLNGSANRRGTLKGGSSWFLLQPGDNGLRLLGTDLGGANMQVTYMDAYR